MDNRRVDVTLRNIIGFIVFGIGVLLIIGSVGALDYLDTCGIKTTDKDLLISAIKAIVGIGICAAAFPIGGPMYYADEESGVNENDGQAEEQAAETVRVGKTRGAGRTRSSAESVEQTHEKI